MSLRILMVSSTVFRLPPVGYSGLEALVWLQATGLAKLGHQVTVAAPDGSNVPGCSLLPTGVAGQTSEPQAFQKYELFLPKFDVVIDHSWQKYVLLWKMKTGNKIPCLSVCHAPVDSMYKSMPDLERPCFVCISEDQGSHFRALFERDCRVARNGICTETYQPLGIPRSDRFLFLARFSTIKGPDLGIQACLEAGVGLDLVGDTSITNEPDFLWRCKELSRGKSPSWSFSSKQIDLIGGVPRSEVPWWMSRANVFLHPNERFREPLGLAPLEALASGCPVISWDRGALKETVPEDVGWRVKSLKQMVEIIKNCHPSDDMRKRCREWACDNFTVDRMVKRYNDLVEEAVQGGGW